MFGWKRKHGPPPVAPSIIPKPAPGVAYIEPQFARAASFVGAALPICGIDVLIVVVRHAVLADPHESNLYVIAFQTRFRRAIVLMAQDEALVPTYFGPVPIVRALSSLPFEVIPWRRMVYRMPRPPAWRLPIPADPMELPSCEVSARGSSNPAGRRGRPERATADEHRSRVTADDHGSALDDIVETHILERSPERAAALARMAQTTRR